MSFIAITYGHQQFSIFNTNVTTFPFIDNIISVCLEESLINIGGRHSSLTKEIEALINEEEKIKSLIKKLELDKLEEEKLIEAKNNEANNQHLPSPKKGRTTNKKQTTQKQNNSLVLNQIITDIKTNEGKLNIVLSNKEKLQDKRRKLIDQEHSFKDLNDNKGGLKIDLVDVYGERVNINSRGDALAADYLINKACYALHRLTESNLT